MSNSKISTKSYGIAVCLAAIFGVWGLHHFYLGRYAMGLFDLVLTIMGLLFLFICFPIGLLLLIFDAGHTIYVAYKLLIGEYHDGKGRKVNYPK